ncbi:hypothetical protein ABZP36_006265 [Zizania latifolia]
MVMPVVLYLALAVRSLRLCSLGIASRGTVALEDLASMDVMRFNMTATVTCNKPYFAQDKIELFGSGVNKGQAIILASRASRSQHELYLKLIDAAILSLLDDPEQHRARFFVALKQMFLTTYIDENDYKCCPHRFGLDILVLTASQVMQKFSSLVVEVSIVQISCSKAHFFITRYVCERLGKLGINVLPAHAVFELAHNNKEVHLNIKGISDIFAEDNSDIVRRLRDFGCRCAMVGCEFLDHDAISGSHIGISVADATDYTKSESDLLYTQPSLISVSSALKTSREICQMMEGYIVTNINNYILLKFGVCAILLLWNFDLSSLLALVIAAFNYYTMKVKKIIAISAAFGSYIVLSTAIFFQSCNNDILLFKLLFPLQMSIVNQVITLFAHSYDCCLIKCPGPVVTFAFILTQMVATRKAVQGDLDFAIAKGVGWLKSGLIWLYNFVLLFAPVLISILHTVLLWLLYIILDFRLQQPVSSLKNIFGMLDLADWETIQADASTGVYLYSFMVVQLACMSDDGIGR